MCILNHWLDNWECFMNARSASQGLGPSVCGEQSSAPVTSREGGSHKSLWPFPLCLNKCKDTADWYENAFFFFPLFFIFLIIHLKWESKHSQSCFVLPGCHLPQQSAAVGLQRSLLGGRADAGGHPEVQSPQRLPLCGGHPAQGQPTVKNSLRVCFCIFRWALCFQAAPNHNKTPRKHTAYVTVAFWTVLVL